MSYAFGPFVAYDSATGALASGGTGSVYEIADTTYATPVSVTHSGGTGTSIPIGASGLVSSFTHATIEEFWWKSGSSPAIRITSYSDAVTAAQPGDPGTTVHAVVWDGTEYATQPATMPGVVLRIAVGPSDPAFTPISGVQDLWIPADI